MIYTAKQVAVKVFSTFVKMTVKTVGIPRDATNEN